MTRKLVGILGGMGPFASSEFVNTIYEENLPDGSEQESPRIVLISDPSIPDRTTSILANQEEEIVYRLSLGWNLLREVGAEVFIIPCMTSHYYWPFYPMEIQERTVNLVDFVHMNLRRERRKSYLLLATQGTYDSGMLLSEQVLIPNSQDKIRIHQLIYSIKCSGRNPGILKRACEEIEDLLIRYQVDGWLFGCTEFHLLTKEMMHRGHPETHILDPLLILAKQWQNLEDFLQSLNIFRS
ncbi:aspartate/glutamate racemase family protein [Bacillus cereus]|uniref:aspartate/glutamate racemase family protein n=1 Tax=Bacillus cereus TaxID=1396 RepID=UPI00187A8FC7|nr:aspartate/glutamate racemase family protein [Bacillus cereus]MBE7122188.1 aspartate/glutamate racemase family protein [Bacillus cereus]